MTFEQMYAKLDEIVKKLEGQGVGLEESIKLFNDGLQLSRKCLESLNQSKGKILLLTDELNKLTEEFNPDGRN